MPDPNDPHAQARSLYYLAVFVALIFVWVVALSGGVAPTTYVAMAATVGALVLLGLMLDRSPR